MLGWLVAVLAVLVGAFYVLGGSAADGGGLEGGQIIYIVACGALVLLYLSTLSSDYRGRWSTALKHAAIWIVLLLALITGYAFRDEVKLAVNRVAGEVLPAGEPLSVDGTEPGERAVRLRRQSDGHFSARADVNGRTIKLLVDTGASTVVLKATDAEKAGIDVGSLSFSVAVDTANGVAYAAPVRLRTVGVGPIAVGDVEALVAKPGSLKESLLGMSFLKRLRSYEFSGDFLTIRG
jgi:aspartyl protease family protein